MITEEIHEGYGRYTIDRFEFEYGRVLENASVEYSLTGTPKFDDEGNIVNAIVYCHSYSGDYASLNNLYEVTQEGSSFDKNEYFLISITSLGVPDSCSPSITGLNQNFPAYSIKDAVNFKRQFLKEKLGIESVHGILARGFGGYEAYTWACEYPDEMDFLIIHSSSYKTGGYRYVIAKCMDTIVGSHDELNTESYDESLSKVMVSVNSLLYSTYFSKRIFQEMSNDEIDVLMDDFIDDGLFMDLYDFKFINDSILNYNIEDKLENIKAKVLIISSKCDIYYSPEFDSLPLKDMIKNSKVILYDFVRKNADDDDFSYFMDDLNEFMSQFKK
ncbi:homoserine acetyltransferase [Methanobrevibacter sp.]|uniref:homoserine acetyltransferase n=1 Tax=Methanobrevibacter sp. TaxID=66852 RepID=UPI003862EA7E